MDWLRKRTVAWSKDDPAGAEIAEVQLGSGHMRASGTAIGSAPEPYRLDYELETMAGFITTRVRVRSCGQGWSRSLILDRSGAGGWTQTVQAEGACGLASAGGDMRALGGALDPDLGLSPLFNTMPVLRTRMLEGRPSPDLLMAWISVPDLSVHASPQRYTFLAADGDGGAVIRFESTGEGEGFSADVRFDADGIVVDYPGIARRIGSGAP